MMPELQQTRVERYRGAFVAECAVEYPMVDTFERRMGFAVERIKLLEAARVLAGPLKANLPNWQHGRVLYAAARNYFAEVWTLVDSTHTFASHSVLPPAMTVLDIGTAKGFSALCLEWARSEAGILGHVYSVDVLDPRGRLFRNTVDELDGPKTLDELLVPWPESQRIIFERSTGVEWLERWDLRVHVAFVDGKHTGEAVRREGALLADRQEPGDLVVFDDVHIPAVLSAVKALPYHYQLLQILPRRAYAIARRQ